MTKKLRTNIKTYIIYTTLSNLLIVGPIMTLFFLEKGLSFTQIMLLYAAAGVSTCLFEVPTGSIGDRVGRKVSLIIGLFLMVLGLCMISFTYSFFLMIAGEVVFSLGTAFKSGSDVALLYDSLKILKMEDQFQKYQGKAHSGIYWGQAIGCIAASLLYKINIHIPFIISIAFVFLSGIIAFAFVEPDISHIEEKEDLSYKDQIKESALLVKGSPKLKALFIYGSCFYIFFRCAFPFYQPYFKAVNIPVIYFGVLFSLFNITAAVISKKSHVIMEKNKGRTLLLLSSLMIASLFLMGLTHMWIGAFAILFQQGARALYSPIVFKHLNKNIPSSKRATVLSLYSLVVNLVTGLAFPLSGLLGDHLDIFNTHLIMGSIMVVLTFMSLSYLKKTQRIASKNIEA